VTVASNLENDINWDNFQLKEIDEKHQKYNCGHGMIKLIAKYSGGVLSPSNPAQCLTFSQISPDEKIARVLIDVMAT
jgi:hypothetical protein